MKIRVKFVGDLQQKVGMADSWIFLPEGATFKEALVELRKRGVKLDLENSSMVIFVNGRRLDFIGGINLPLKDLDEIVVMPIIAGGNCTQGRGSSYTEIPEDPIKNVLDCNSSC